MRKKNVMGIKFVEENKQIHQINIITWCFSEQYRACLQLVQSLSPFQVPHQSQRTAEK